MQPVKVLLSLICCLLTFGNAEGAWLYSRSITINPTVDVSQVPSDRPNMPTVLRGPFTHLAFASGKITDTTNGFDAAIATDAACTTIIPSYREVKTVSTGDVNYWFAPSVISASAPTVLYQCYGNSSYTTNHSTPVGVWDSNYRAVYLFPDGTTLSGVDALGNFNLTNHGATADSSGVVGGAAAMSGVYLDTANFSLGGPDLTVSCWMNSSNFSQNAEVIDKEPVNGDWSLLFTSGGLQIRGGSSNAVTTPAPSNNNWHYVVAKIEHTGVTGAIYIDGVEVVAPTGGLVDPIANSTNTLNIAQYTGAGGTFNFNGKLDIIAISNSIRPVDQGIAEYANQKLTSSLIVLGSEVPLGGAAALPSLGAFVF
jgi:hypothetical protein